MPGKGRMETFADGARMAGRTPRGPTAVVVAGMHRSGTSAVTRIINLLGFDLPKTLYAPRPDNPLGYWEPLAVVEAHDEFLASVGSSYDDVFPLADAVFASATARTLEDRLVEILQTEFAVSRQFVVKDPRICRLVPLWLSALERFGAEPRFVLTIRNPLEVAASLKLRNDYSVTKSLMLWLRHVLEAERHTRGRARSIVSYEDVLRDWRSSLDRVASDLDLSWSRSSHLAHAEIEEFLSPRRRHHAFDRLEVESRADIADWVKRAYGALAVGATGEPVAYDVLDAVRAELDRADLVFGPLLAESTLALSSKTEALDKETSARQSAEAELLEQRAALAALEPGLEASEREVERRETELAELNGRIAIRESELEESRADLERLSSELTARNDVIAGQDAELDATRRELRRLTGDLDTTSEMLALHESELGETQAELDRVAQQLADRTLALTLRESELDALRRELECVAAEMAVRDQALAERTDEIGALDRRIGQLDTALSLQAEELTRARDNAASLAGEAQGLSTKLAAAEATLAERGRERKKLTRRLAKRDDAIRRAKRELESIIVEKRLLDDAHGRNKVRIVELTEEIGASRRSASALEVEVAGLTAALADRDAKGAEHEALAVSLRADVERLTAELEARDKAIIERDAGIVAARGELETVRTELAARTSEMDRLTRELQARQAETLASTETINALRSVVEEQAGQIQSQNQRLEELSRRRWRRPRLPTLPDLLRGRRGRVRSPAGPSRRGLSGRWRSCSQFASWLLHARSGGMRNVRTYREIRRSGSFDAARYLSRYVDVAEARLDPLMHYVEHGAREGRIPSTGFDSPSLGTEDRASPMLEPAAAEPLPDVPPAPESPPPPAAVSEPVVAAPAPAAPPAAPAPAQPRSNASANGRIPPKSVPYVRGPIEPTDISDFTILLSRQRSGTNAIRSILETHPDVFCFNEVFNFADKDSNNELLRESNFFTFLERYAGDDISRTFPDNHERLFLDFLEYLRCLALKPHIVIDVKYNTTHFLTQQWPAEVGASYLFELLAKHGARVFNVTRKNYLRYVLSTDKAWYSDRYTVDRGDATYRDTARWLDPDYVLSELERCRREDAVVERAFSSYRRLLTRDYVAIFPGGDEPVAPGFLDEVAGWLCVPNVFRADPIYRKQSTLPLDETLENYDEVAAALRGTAFAYCLDDEPSYRRNGSGGPRDVPEPSTPPDWSAVIGSEPDHFCDELSRARPEWVKGSISFDDVRFLFRQALEHGRDLTVEIGTASGMSTAVLGHAAHFRHLAGTGGADWTVVSYDIQPQIYFDESRRVGDAACELLPQALLDRLEFRQPATAADVADHHRPDEIEFMFIDANHKHPWPSLDLLATLEVLAPGAVVVLHDVNLPLLHPEFAAWGVKHVFDELDVEKAAPEMELPNIGSITIPRNKEPLRRQLLELVAAHDWEVAVSEKFTARLLPPAAARQPAGA